MVDLRRMMLLADLADLGTVTAVAERRNITSSAVSQQLRVLEDEAGAILFRKDGRTLGLTRSGKVLVEHVRRVLGALAEESWVTGLPGSTLAQAVQLIGDGAGFEPRITHRLVGAQNICGRAATEVASAVVPRYSVPRLLQGLIVEDVVAGSRTLHAVVREGRQRDPKIAAVVRELKDIARGLDATNAPAFRLVAAS